jgi:hypothetical protein
MLACTVPLFAHLITPSTLYSLQKVREALHADAFDVDKKKANRERKTYEISSSSSSSSPSPDTSPPPPPPSTSIAGGRTALLWLVGGLAHADGDGEK